jgi:hypothetical protein
MKYCLINQAAGLGDIIFCQKIAIKIKERYNIPIIWPVIPEYLHIKDYIDNDIIFVDVNSNFQGKNYMQTKTSFANDELIYLALNRANLNIGGRIMEAKYKSVQLSHEDWVDYFSFKRNKEKENCLFYDILKLKDSEEYILVNKQFSSPPHTIIWDIKFPSNFKKVDMCYVEDFSIFDWCKVIEEATGIYTMDSSITLFIEKLNTKAKYIEITSRRPGNWSEVDYLYKKPFKKAN